MRPVTRFALALATVLAIAGCGTDTGSAPATPTQQIATTLCRAVEVAASDPGAAERAFDEAHAPLHDLARSVQTIDRPAAARLLEAKQAVEAAFAEEPAPADLVDRLSALHAATAAAVATGETTTADC